MLDRHECFSVFHHLQKDKQRKQRHSLKLSKKRRESSKRNYYIISPRVIIKAIIITTCRDFDIGQWTPGHGRGGGAIHGKHEKEAVCNSDQPVLFDGSACPTYRVFVTFRHGVLSFGVHSGITVGGLKYLVYLRTTVLERKIKLTSTANHAGNVTALDIEATLYDCGFGTESTIHAVLYNEKCVALFY